MTTRTPNDWRVRKAGGRWHIQRRRRDFPLLWSTWAFHLTHASAVVHAHAEARRLRR